MKFQFPFDLAGLKAFCQKWGVQELSVFGSALRPDFSATSDIDLLVTFQEGQRISLLDWPGMQEELQKIFGRRVDLISRRGVERSGNYIRKNEILTTAKPLYAAAA